MSKYYYNKDYFEQIDSEEKAYWLGFLYADGSIYRFYKNDKIRSMTLELQLCKSDESHLVKFIKALESNVPIKNKKNIINGKEYYSSVVKINCTKLCYDLIALGCTPQKTFSIKFPSDNIVPFQFKKSFLRGFFDGDGCICLTEMNNKPHLIATFSGIEDMLKSISSFLIENKIIAKPPKIHHDKRSMACSIYFYGNDLNRFLDYIYGDAKIYLDRKYNKYIEYYKDFSLIDYHGIYWSKSNKAYIVTIYMNGKKVLVGQTKDINEAVKLRMEAEITKYKQPT